MEHEPSGDVPEVVERVLEWSGATLDGPERRLLRRFADWLVEEAIPAGGLGPGEADRLWDRHIADSLSMAAGIPPTVTSLLDVGTGVGLPGIPLALAFPGSLVTLLDRAGRRTRLAERAVRILDLDRVVVIRRDIHTVSGRYEAITFRGALPPLDAIEVAARLLAPDGVAVLAVSRRPERPDATAMEEAAIGAGLETELVRVPESILDGGGWTLNMRRRGDHSGA